MPTSFQRDPALDALRGLALCGVAVINALYFFNPIGLVHALFLWGEPAVSSAPLFVLRALVEYKAWFVLGGLFGFFAARRLRAPGKRWTFARRLLGLAVLGAANFAWFSPVDILLVWSLCGAVLLLVSPLSWRWLAAGWLLAAVVAGVASTPVSVTMPWRTSAADLHLYREMLGAGASEVARLGPLERIRDYLAGAAFLFPYSLSAVLFGAALERCPESWRQRLRELAARRWTAWLALGAALGWGALRLVSIPFLPSVANLTATVLLVTPFAPVFGACWLHRRFSGAGVLGRETLARLGRHSLWHYLAQSVAFAALARAGWVPPGKPLDCLAGAAAVLGAQIVAAAVFARFETSSQPISSLPS